MMNRILKITLCFALGLSLSMSITSCNGAKAYVKKAYKLEEAGMHEQAAVHYMTALGKKPDNVDAHIGLKRTGQIVLSRHLADFDEAVMRNDRESAIRSFKKADSYNNTVANYGVTLAFPAEKRTQYEGVKNAHVQEIYVEGSKHLENLEYAEALVIFEEIEGLVPGFKDAKQLGDYCYCKPRFDNAKEFMKTEMYRSAHRLYTEILARDGDFENSADLLQESLEKGKYTIALMKFENGSNRNNVETKLSAYAEQKLMNSSDPFLTIVDRESLEMILQEQHLELSGLTSGSELEIGEILGAKAILKGTVMDCSYNKSSPQQQRKNGFEKYKVEKINSEGKKYYETKYKPVYYWEYSQSADVRMTFNIKMISMTTGQIITSETVSTNLSDQVRYANYGGNNNDLVPANFSGNADTSTSGRNNLRQLLGARRDLKNKNTMIDNATQNLAGKILSEVESIMLQEVR